MENEEITRAKTAHSRASYLNSDRIIISKPDRQIVHSLGPFHPVAASSREEIESFSMPALPPRTAINPFYWVEEWTQGGDHELLFSMIRRGVVPQGWNEPSATDTPPTYAKAIGTARCRGYRVPENSNRPPGKGEHEAWYAAQMVARGHFDPFIEPRVSVRRDIVYQHTGQFIVPDRLVGWKWPYVLDQLWITRGPGETIRLLALEVDEPVHLEPEQRAKDRERDSKLAEFGYEVYRVSAGWCVVDPFRVVCEFLAASGLVSDAPSRIAGGEFDHLEEYVCQHCGELMIRGDMDWIQEAETLSGKRRVVHRQCVFDVLSSV